MNRPCLAALTAAGLLFWCACVRIGIADADAGLERGARVVNGVIAQDRPTTGALLRTSGINHHAICSGTLIGCKTFLIRAWLPTAVA